MVFYVPSDTAAPFWVLDFRRRTVARALAAPPDYAAIVKIGEGVLADAIEKNVAAFAHISMRLRIDLAPGGVQTDFLFWGLLSLHELGYFPFTKWRPHGPPACCGDGAPKSGASSCRGSTFDRLTRRSEPRWPAVTRARPPEFCGCRRAARWRGGSHPLRALWPAVSRSPSSLRSWTRSACRTRRRMPRRARARRWPP